MLKNLKIQTEQTNSGKFDTHSKSTWHINFAATYSHKIIIDIYIAHIAQASKRLETEGRVEMT